MSQGSLSGKTALVTGAVRRLGRATALALAREGANVVLHHRVEETSRAACAELTRLGVRAWSIAADLARPKEYETLIERTLERAGTLDILVNNAAIFLPDTMDNVDYDGLLRHIEVNAWVPFVLGRDFARRVGRGQIVNLLDARISTHDWNHVAYILSKHLLAGMTEMMALKFAPAITVNAVAPGLILPPPGKADSYLDVLATKVPLQRHGEAADIAEAIIYLLKSTYLTGQVIYVDGGRGLVRSEG